MTLIKLQLSDAERAHLDENRGLTTDLSGNEILRGLTSEESSELLTLRRERLRNSKSRDRRIELHEKHELARISAVVAEVDARSAGTKH
jgi:hypothetical protein